MTTILLTILGIYLLGVLVARGVILSDLYAHTRQFVGQTGYHFDALVNDLDAEDRRFMRTFQFFSWMALLVHVSNKNKLNYPIFTGFKLK